MSIKAFFALIFAFLTKKKVLKWAYNPHKTQEKVFKKLILKLLIRKSRKYSDGKNLNSVTLSLKDGFALDPITVTLREIKRYKIKKFNLIEFI